MQVNIRGSPCISGVFLYCFSHRKKRNLALRVHENTQFWPKNPKNVLGRGHCPLPKPLPCREGNTPSSHPTLLAPSAPWLGSSLRRSTLLPTSTFGSAYGITACPLVSSSKTKPFHFSFISVPFSYFALYASLVSCQLHSCTFLRDCASEWGQFFCLFLNFT